MLNSCTHMAAVCVKGLVGRERYLAGEATLHAAGSVVVQHHQHWSVAVQLSFFLRQHLTRIHHARQFDSKIRL